MNPQELQRRSHHICGTDIGAIVGLNPWRGPMDVFLEKLGQGAPVADNERMRWGRDLEPVVAARYAADHAVQLAEYGFMQHDQHSWWGGTPDRYVLDMRHGLEIKTTGARQADKWGEPGTDQIPEHYLLQCAWYAPLLHVERMDVAVLIGGQDYREYVIHRDPELEFVLAEAGEKFWRDHVLAQVPPPLDSSDGTRRYLESRWPVNNGTILTASPEVNELVAMLKQARGAREKYAQIAATLEARLQAEIGDADGLDTELGRITWRRSKDTATVVWEDVARALNPPEQLIRNCSKPKPGTRRFVVPRDWGKESDA